MTKKTLWSRARDMAVHRADVRPGDIGNVDVVGEARNEPPRLPALEEGQVQARQMGEQPALAVGDDAQADDRLAALGGGGVLAVDLRLARHALVVVGGVQRLLQPQDRALVVVADALDAHLRLATLGEPGADHSVARVRGMDRQREQQRRERERRPHPRA